MAYQVAYSYSRLAKYEQCPAAYNYRYVLKLPEPQSPAMGRGDRVHKNIAALLTSVTLPHPEEAPPTKFKEFVDLIEQLKQQRPFVEQQWAYDADWKPVAWFGPTVRYRAILDVGVLWDNGAFTAIDWKTGRPYGDNVEQLEQQALSVFAKFPRVNYVEALLEYLDTGQELREGYTRVDAPKLIDKWERRAAPLLHDQKFAPRPGKYCTPNKEGKGGCHFRKSNGGPCAFG